MAISGGRLKIVEYILQKYIPQLNESININEVIRDELGIITNILFDENNLLTVEFGSCDILEYALSRDSLELLKLLIKHGGADVNGRGSDGRTMLGLALSTNYSFEIVSLILAAKSDMNAVDINGHK